MALIGPVNAGPTTAAQPSCWPTWLVSPGDTLFRISRRCGVSIDGIARANAQVDWNRLAVGTQVRLDTPRTAPSPRTDGGGSTYVVRRGDTLFSIARTLGMSVQALGDANPHLSPNDLRPGQRLVLAPAPDREAGIHVVGVLTDEGIECRALRGRDGRLYTLSGRLGGFRTGDVVTVRGRTAEMSTCMQGTTIAVESIHGGS